MDVVNIGHSPIPSNKPFDLEFVHSTVSISRSCEGKCDISPIKSDSDEVQYRSGAAEHVPRGPHIAEARAQRPALRNLVDGAERHHEARHQQVRHGQRENQVVGGAAQVPLQ